MVFPERYVNSPNYLSLRKIKNAIRSGQVRGFISEGFGTVEAVRRENRAKFHAQNVPKVEVTNKSHGNGLNFMTIEIKANHSLHPGIGEEFEEELTEALAIGHQVAYNAVSACRSLIACGTILTFTPKRSPRPLTTTSGLAMSSELSLTEE
jgi:hypothetical protein